VVYFDPESGECRLLSSEEYTVESDRIVFYADSVCQFALLADATVELGGVLIALTVLILAQLVILALLLFDFFKKKHAGATAPAFALPLFALLVRFSPDGAVAAVWILGAIALCLQAAIVIFILRGRVAYHPPVAKPAPEEELDGEDLDEEEDLEEDIDEELEEEDLDEDFEEDLDEEDVEEDLDEDFEGDSEDEEYAYAEAADEGVTYLDSEAYGEASDKTEEAPQERIFFSEDGEVFFGESEATKGMREYVPGVTPPLSEEDADETEPAPVDEPLDEVDEESYRYDE
jgi:hypothetical protein